MPSLISNWIVLISTTLYFTFQICHSINCVQNAQERAGKDFIYDCTEDGNYKPTQCEPRTGYCFCVDVIDGKAMRDTSFRLEQKDNNDCTKMNNARLSGEPYKKSVFHLLEDNSSKPSVPAKETIIGEKATTEVKPLRHCNKKEREHFLQHIASKMKKRIGIQRSGPAEIDRSTADRTHKDYDNNFDDRLNKTEFRGLELYVRRLFERSDGSLQPSEVEQCINTFHRYCDQNGDNHIDRDELFECMNAGKVSQITSKHRRGRGKQMPANSNNNNKSASGSIGNTQWANDGTGRASKQRVARNEERKRQKNNKLNGLYPESLTNNAENRHSLLSSSSSSSLSSPSNVRYKENQQHQATSKFGFQKTRGSSSIIQSTASSGIGSLAKNQHTSKAGDSGAFDCFVTRDNSRRIGNFTLECAVNGSYKPLQCQLDSCWCVSPITGKTISKVPKNSTLNCDTRSYRNCDSTQRKIFHQELQKAFEKEKKSCSKIFAEFDDDDNGFIRQKEWRQMRRSIRDKLGNSKVKKCNGSALKFCDLDSDGRMSKDEWRYCCEMYFDSSSDSSHQSSTADRYSSQLYGGNDNQFQSDNELRKIYNEKKDLPRKGMNPFQSILKSD